MKNAILLLFLGTLFASCGSYSYYWHGEEDDVYFVSDTEEEVDIAIYQDRGNNDRNTNTYDTNRRGYETYPQTTPRQRRTTRRTDPTYCPPSSPRSTPRTQPSRTPRTSPSNTPSTSPRPAPSRPSRPRPSTPKANPR